MFLASFELDGRASWGRVEESRLSDLGSALGPGVADLKQALCRFDVLELVAAAAAVPCTVPVERVRFLPVVPQPDKIFCVGLNYRAHVIETGRETPGHPGLFTRFGISQVGHDQPLVRPLESPRFDFEGELAVVIGRAGRRISEAESLEHVAGYSCFNDGSIRDWQAHSTQFTAGKNFLAAGSFGPWLATRDVIPDPAALELTTRLNGQVMQHAPVSDLIFGVPALISYISTFTALGPGDVIVTGTPGGVGMARNPRIWLQPGDVLEVEIPGIGVLRNPVIDEAEAS